VNEPVLAPAFYNAPARVRRRAARDWWLVLHPPYTAWHLSYVVIGACISAGTDGVRLGATVLAFFLAVGVGAHALDELNGRPLRTSLPSPVLAVAAVIGVGGAVAIGLAGVPRVGPGLLVFIAVGVVLAVGYNLELVGGRLHTDVWFAVAWGAFPVLTAHYAQVETVRVEGVLAAVAAFCLADAQRQLSTPARTLRRKVYRVDGVIEYADGRTSALDAPALLAPLERTLRALTATVIAFATALAVARFWG
jgi:hypothetical protein